MLALLTMCPSKILHLQLEENALWWFDFQRISWSLSRMTHSVKSFWGVQPKITMSSRQHKQISQRWDDWHKVTEWAWSSCESERHLGELKETSPSAKGRTFLGSFSKTQLPITAQQIKGCDVFRTYEMIRSILDVWNLVSVYFRYWVYSPVIYTEPESFIFLSHETDRRCSTESGRLYDFCY